MNLDSFSHIHIIGVGGSGMSAIARVLAERGFSVSGSDMQESKFSAELRKLGVRIHIGHSATYVSDAELVVRSSAIPDSNPEVVAARLAGVSVLKRSEFLGSMMAGQIGIAVAGTHGKTTTTSMIAQVLIEAGLDPTVVVGGIVPMLGSNARAGNGDHFLIEADEYDRMFLGLDYEIALINNLEHDHPDIFEDDAAYVDAFAQFAAQTPAHGQLILNGDDELSKPLGEQAVCDIYRVGLSDASDLWAEDIRPNQLGGNDFIVMERGNLLGIARLRVPGEHNVRNALMAIAVTHSIGVDFHHIRKGLAEFGGVGRRFQELGTVGNVTVIDDYAHHPTEIRATLAAAQQHFVGRTVWAVWQPHTYSRVKLHFDAFTAAFADADKAIALDIYRSRERDTLGMSSALLVNAMVHPYAKHINTIEAAATYILDRISPDDVVITLSAGDGNRVGTLVLDGLRERSAV
ncbi:MAG: UDP-N-acetylmuramate--L-alanine ligase [Candidatus Promineifilaceae bacterium]